MNEPVEHTIETTDGVTVTAWDFAGPDSAGPDSAAPDSAGEGPPIVFCHATGFHSRVWDPIIEIVSKHHRCISVDLRGHGNSHLPGGVEMQWFDIARDLLAAVDHLNLGDGLFGVGHSLGGGTIFQAEHQRPGTFAKAWLFEPIAIPSTFFAAGHRSELSESALRRREVFDSRDAVYERYMSRPPFGACEPATIRRYVDYGFADQDDGTVILKCRGKVEAETFDSTPNSGTFEMLPEILNLHAVIVGSADGQVPAVTAPQIADALPNGTFVYDENATHFGPLEATAKSAAAILDTFAS